MNSFTKYFNIFILLLSEETKKVLEIRIRKKFGNDSKDYDFLSFCYWMKYKPKALLKFLLIRREVVNTYKEVNNLFCCILYEI